MCFVCSNCFTNLSPFMSLSLLRLLYSLRQKKIIEIRIADTQTMTSKYSSKRKSYPTLNLNHKLDVIKFSKEGMLKAEID